MEQKATIRDAVIIFIIVFAGIWALGSRADGPVETAMKQLDNHAGHDHEVDMSGNAEDPHNQPREIVEPSDGDPVITLGGHSIGSIWFDTALHETVREYQTGGTDELTAHDLAMEDMVLMSLKELVIVKAIDDYKLEPSEETMSMLQQEFEDSFETSEEMDEYLKNMGTTIEQQQESWELDSILIELRAAVVPENIDPESDEGWTAFQNWLTEQVDVGGFEIHDEKILEVYEDALENGWKIR